MKITHYSTGDRSLPEAALKNFERCFDYPLGAEARFRISHGPNYLTFFRAMGEAHLLAAEGTQGIAGTLALVGRRGFLAMPGTRRPLAAHYLCDLKVASGSRATPVLAHLIRTAKARIEASATQACYSIVMDGTGRLPTDYTGRLGVPPFLKAAQIVILRVQPDTGPVARAGVSQVSQSTATAVREGLAPYGYSFSACERGLRSSVEPVGLVDSEGLACGILEDTRKAKKLFDNRGEEIISAHLSGFAFSTATAGAKLLEHATWLGRSLGFPALFVSVPAPEAGPLLSAVCGLRVHEAPASVYAYGFRHHCQWYVDTADI